MLLKVMAWPIMTVWCCLCRKLNPHALVMGWSSNNTFKEIVFDTSLNSNWLLIGVYVSKDVRCIQLPSTPVLLDPMPFFFTQNGIEAWLFSKFKQHNSICTYKRLIIWKKNYIFILWCTSSCLIYHLSTFIPPLIEKLFPIPWENVHLIAMTILRNLTVNKYPLCSNAQLEYCISKSR